MRREAFRSHPVAPLRCSLRKLHSREGALPRIVGRNPGPTTERDPLHGLPPTRQRSPTIA